MPGFVRKILIFITGYAWLLLLAGPGLIGLSLYSGWKAEGDHAYAARDSLQSVAGTVTQASEVTVKRKRRSTRKYYEITVKPDAAGAEERKLRIDYGTPQQLVGNLIDEKITALVDKSDSDLVYEVAVDGKAVISYEATRQRLQAEAASSAQSFSGAGTWIFAIVLTLLGAAGVWCNRKLRAAGREQQPSAA
jgi:cobalamin biosynthesis Mg chelatase CobN